MRILIRYDLIVGLGNKKVYIWNVKTPVPFNTDRESCILHRILNFIIITLILS